MASQSGSFKAIWGNRSSVWAAILFGVSFLLLPLFPPIHWLHDSVIEPATRIILEKSSLTTATDDHRTEIWILSGLLVNLVSIIFAIGAVIGRGSADRFDLIMQILFTVAALAIFVAMAFVRFLTPIITLISVIFYGLYFSSDIAGTIKYWSDARSKATYLFPLLCLDMPALVTSIIILTAGDNQFAHGMAAGHLVFAAIGYFGIVAVLLPWALHVLCGQPVPSVAQSDSARPAVGG